MVTTQLEVEETRTHTAGWAVLGPGGIARRFLTGLASSSGQLVAVGSSDAARAHAFADDASRGDAVDITAGDYAHALADPRVDAVYVSSVHTGHAPLALAAIAAGKAVLCEKPLAVNHGTAMALVDAAQQAGVPLVEAYMYRFHPQTRALLGLIRDGAIGRVLHIEASFAFRTGGRSGRLYDPAVAGGGILDVGGYPATMAAAIVDAADGVHASEPVELLADGVIGPTGVDEWTVARATYRSGITATLTAGVMVQASNSVTVLGERGSIRVAEPWVPTGSTEIELANIDGVQRIAIAAADAYGLEADATIAALRAGRADAPEMTSAETLATARTLDRWRAAIGLRYPFEAEDADIPPVRGGFALGTGLGSDSGTSTGSDSGTSTGSDSGTSTGSDSGTSTGSDDVTMRYGTIPGVGKRMSRLIMGVDNQPDLAHASAVFDVYAEAGGNVFDTAYIYGDGELERRLGRWIANRGIREDVVVITKGGHTPHCDPESVSRQLIESLERQGTDYADIYMLHRDNPEVPVGEFVDVLDEHVRAGRIRVFGGSNWTPARVDEANAYAQANGRQGFSVLSDHFGLAEAYDVPWEGCVHVTDEASQRWLVDRQIPLLPWSSQARGFFAGRAHPDDRRDAELVRCYYSDDNFERLRRAESLGAERGVPTTAIALAYVLAQPFPTFPLFGPRTIEETRSSMRGLTVDLTPEEVAWLNLRS